MIKSQKNSAGNHLPQDRSPDVETWTANDKPDGKREVTWHFEVCGWRETSILKCLLSRQTTLETGGGGYFLIRGYWGCAAGWGRVFTAGLTIMGLHFWSSYLNGIAHFRDFWDKKILVSKDLNIGRFAVKKWFVLLFQNLTVGSHWSPFMNSQLNH